MTKTKLQRIFNNINTSFQGKQIELFSGTKGDSTWIQVGMERPDCNDTSIIEIGKGGKAFISKYATEDEVVKKILGLVLAYVEHEVREGFYYKNKRIFNPHISINALIKVCDDTWNRL